MPEKTRVEKVKRNVLTSIALQIIKILLSFIGRMIFVRILGSTYLGLNGLFSNILTVLSVADLGMGTVMMYSLYKPLAENDERKIAAYISTFKKIYITIAVIVLTLGIISLPFLQYMINLPENVDGVYLYYLLMLTNIVIGYLFIYRTTLLQADQKSYILDSVDIVAQIVIFAAQTLILFLTKNYGLYLGLSVATTFVTNVIKSSFVSKRYKYLKNYNLKLEKEDKKALVTNLKGIFLYRIGAAIQSNTDNILISIFVSTIAVGLYSNYAMVVSAITSLISMIFLAIKSTVGNFNSKAKAEDQQKFFYFFEDYNYLLIAFFSICFYVLLPDFIRICFGSDYILSSITTVFIVLNFYTSNIRQNIWVYRETTGLFNKVKYVTLVTSSLNLVTSLICGYFFGITGIIAATVLSRMVYAWWREPLILFHTHFKTSAKKYFVSYISKLLYACSIALLLSILVQNIIFENALLQGAVRAIVVMTVSVPLLYAPFAKKDSMKTLKRALIKRTK